MTRKNNYQIQHSQNFLVNKRLVRDLVNDAGFQSTDTVLEIGPGKGIITRELAERAGHVIAIEKDDHLTRRLLRKMSLPQNVTLYTADALTFPLPTTPYRVFSNIPFRFTAAIVGKLTTGVAPPFDTRLIVQREAAERFMVTHDSTMRAQQLAPFFDVEILHTFHARDFSPSPGVECVLMGIRQRQRPHLPIEERTRFGKFVDVVYSAWQPSLEKAIRSALPRLAAQEVLSRRGVRTEMKLKASEVSPSVWIEMYESLLERDDDKVWQQIGNQYARIEANRNSLDRPTQTRSRKSGNRRR